MTQAPPPLSDEALAALRSELQASPQPKGDGTPPRRLTSRRSDRLQPIASRAKRTVKQRIERGIAWYVDAKAEEAAQAAAARVHAEIAGEVRRDLDESAATRINLELLKGELRELQGILDDLGQAIAPAAGLPGARGRMAELREKVNDLDRRTKRIAARRGEAATGGGDGVPTYQSTDHRFDYVGFERRFRGDSDAVTRIQLDRYLEVVRAHEPVLDIGCGRGEFVGALNERGITAEGVDLDEDAVAEAVSLGRNVRRQDAVTALREAQPGAYGAAVAFHLVEHLELEPLVSLLEEVAARLRPGGVFVAETPNPASLIVLGNSYILDPTHVRPLHPSLLVFLCERAGFSQIELRFHAPADAYQLPRIDAADAPQWVEQVNAAFTRLNDVLFGPQEYAVIAQTPHH